MRFTTLLLIPAVALAAGCAASTYPLNPQLAAQVGLNEPPSYTERVSNDVEGASDIVQRGACSWYGPGFHGRRTSNGETFDKNALTAAHPYLPFGSEVEVTDVDSGKTVRVRINDRGPFIHGRVLDLSYAAAATLDIVHKGVADVLLKLVDVADADWTDEIYALQVASFRRKADAENFLERLTAKQRAAGLYYVKEPDQPAQNFSVRIGPFSSESNARSAANRVHRVGLKPFVLREDLAGSGTAASKTTTVN